MAHDYLTVADVLGMHTVLMQRYGGAPGVREPGALEAALFRPQTGYYDDIVAEAAALLESLAINHPFVDGNKRTAHVCYRVFLVLNGVELQARDEDKYIAMLGLADGALAEAAFADWIRKHLTPKPGSQLHEPEARYGG